MIAKETAVHYRRGTFLIRRIAKIPSAAVSLPFSGSVLGEGEVRHELPETEKVSAYRLAEGLYLDVRTETDLVHPEHERVALFPGTYEVIRQTEYTRKEFAD